MPGGYARPVTTEPEADGRARPSGRAAVMDAVLDAATELIADRGPNAVTVRAIAELAGVNHALVHRYFGSKEDLIGAVIAREVAYFRRLAEGEGGTTEVFGRLLRGLSAHDAYVRFLARAILDGYRAGQLKLDFVLFREVLGIVEPNVPLVAAEGTPDVRIVVAALGSMALGWRIFGDFLAAGLGLDTMPPAQLDSAIDGFITSVLLARPADRIPGGET